MSADQQLAFCRLSQRLVNAVLTGILNDRELFDLSLQLNILQSYSGLAQTIGRNHRAVYELVEQIEVAGGVARVDVPTLRSLASQKFSDPEYIDYIGWLDETTVLCGPLDEAEDREYRFAVAASPAWLHREQRLAK